MTKSKSWLALLFPVLVLVVFEVSAQLEPALVNENSSLAKPLLIVTPEYPKNASPDKKHVEVRVRGRVTATGDFATADFSAGEGEEDFVQAVREVLPKWRFIPAIDRGECKAKEYDATLFVWFDMKSDGPAISASMPPKDAALPKREGEAAPTKFPRRKWTPSMYYPVDARRAGIEGTVIALLKVNKSGDVQVNILAYSPTDI